MLFLSSVAVLVVNKFRNNFKVKLVVLFGCRSEAMASLIESYEQQYAVLTAEITSEIGKLKRMPAGN